MIEITQIISEIHLTLLISLVLQTTTAVVLMTK